MGQVLAVVSGKGGTGKTSISAGIAIALAEAGKTVLCMDLDLGLRNLDLSLGMAQEPALNVLDVISGSYPLQKAAVHPQYQTLQFLTAPVTRTPESMDPAALCQLLAQARELFDWCILDAPAGIGPGFHLAVQAADQVLVVTGSDPAALRDGNRTAQELARYPKVKAILVVNRIRTKLFKRIRLTVDDCMDAVGLPLLGIVPEDESVSLATATGRHLMDMPKKRKGAAAACRNIANRLQGVKAPLLKL